MLPWVPWVSGGSLRQFTIPTRRASKERGERAILYIVATPIGNLEDITQRALRVLREVKLIAAEDTRTTRHLLSAYDIHTPLTSYHDGNKRAKLPSLLERMAKEDVALVSEAGMPGMNDPGYELVQGAVERGIPVVPIPGPSAILTALVVSGLPTTPFLYLGFLPRRKGERKRLLESADKQGCTMVAFESPHRLSASLQDALEVLGDRKMAVCRELTKVYEEVFRGSISQAIEHCVQPRGEFTLVFEGRREKEPATASDATALLQELKREGRKAKEAVGMAAQETGLPKKELYRLWLKLG